MLEGILVVFLIEWLDEGCVSLYSFNSSSNENNAIGYRQAQDNKEHIDNSFI